MMKAVLPFYKGAHTCDTIKRTAFDAYAGCYVESRADFCKMAVDEANWDALWKVFEPKGDWDQHTNAAWREACFAGTMLIHTQTH